jgi:hypothetical protein
MVFGNNYLTKFIRLTTDVLALFVVELLDPPRYRVHNCGRLVLKYIHNRGAPSV